MSEATPHMPVGQTAQPDAERPSIHSLAVAGLLALILAVGAYFRLVGFDWDKGQHLHPDERFLSMVESSLKPVASLGEYFDTPHSTLNPNNQGYGFFVYGDLPIILVQYVGAAREMASYSGSYLVGRALSAAFDLAALLLLFLVARQLYRDDRIALLAAALAVASVLSIQLSHFFTVDTFANAFVVGAFLFAARALDEERWSDHILFGLLLGLGMASKASVFPLGLMLVVAGAIRLAPQMLIALRGLRSEEADEVRRALLHGGLKLAAAGLAALLAFRVAQPYAFLPPGSDIPAVLASCGENDAPLAVLDRLGMRPNPCWLGDMREVRFQLSGQADIPPNHQWATRPKLIFPWKNMTQYGMGWPLGLAGWLGWAWAIWEIARGHHGWRRHILPVVWVGLFFGWQGIGWVLTMRYFLPVYPFLILLAAWALVTLWDRLTGLVEERGAGRRSWPVILAAGLIGCVLLGTYAWAFAFSRIYTRPVTRVAASEWIYEHVPSDVTLILETPQGTRNLQIGLPNEWLPPGSDETSPTEPGVRYTRLEAGEPLIQTFEVPFDGTLSGVRLNHVADPSEEPYAHTLRVALTSDPYGEDVLIESSLQDSFASGDDPRGKAYRLDLSDVEFRAGERYTLVLEATGGPLILAGASLATEGAWDDALPVPMPPYNIWNAQFQGYELEMSWEDTPDKRARMGYILDHADYVVISSNRFYGSLTRIPSRWPMALEYYRALFDGELGFELAADFTSYPNLGPLQFDDQGAEEAFTVYDHPRVLIFRKTRAYGPENTAQILGRADLTNVERLRADNVHELPARLELPTSRPASDGARTPTGTLGGGLFAVVVWWLLIAGLGWIAFPVLFFALPGLPDRAYPLARAFGLLFVAWLGWFAASLGPLRWSIPTLVACVLALAGASALVAVPRREMLLAWLRANRRYLLAIEGLTLALFVLFLLIRLGNPDLWHPSYGGEKPMDFAYFNAVLRSRTFPPYDPWFAGGYINYYYFGFVIVGVPVRLLGLMPSIAYNLILPTLYALTGVGAFSAAFNLTTSFERWRAPGPTSAGEGLRVERLCFPSSAWLAGLIALCLAVLLGNLDQIRTILFGLAEIGSGVGIPMNTPLPPLGDVLDGIALQLSSPRPLPVGLGEWYWNATRLIPVPINEAGLMTEVQPITEFPFFSFLYADLHAHMIAMPIQMLALGWCINRVCAVTAEQRLRAPRSRLDGVELFIGGLAIGALRPTNSWDWPTYLVLGVGAVGLAAAARIAAGGARPRTIGGALIGAATLIGLSFALYLPFLRSFQTAYSSVGAWSGSHTPLWAYLDIHGLFLFLIVSFLVWEGLTWARSEAASGRAGMPAPLVAGVIGLVLGVLLAWKDYQVALVALPLIGLALALLFRPRQAPERRAAYALIAFGLAATLAVEMVVLRGDVSRMNTVFKFYLQVWMWFSVAAGVAAAWLAPVVLRWRPMLRGAWLVALIGLVGLSVLYPVLAAQAKIDDRMASEAPHTLDGMEFMRYAQRFENGQTFSLAPDYYALRWLQSNVAGQPVVLEANIPEYRWGSRVSIYTGLPSIVGWNWHQRQQRSLISGEVVFGRVQDVTDAYNTTSVDEALRIIDRYDVEYIIVGDLERAYYDASGLAKFETMAGQGLLEVVYSQDGTTIYRVTDDA